MHKELASVITLKPYQCNSAGKLSFVGGPDDYHTPEFDLKGPIRLKLSMVSKIVQDLHMRSKEKPRSSCHLFSCSCQSAGHERPNCIMFCRSLSLLHSSCYDPFAGWLKGLLPFPPSNGHSSLGILSLSHTTALSCMFTLPDLQVPSAFC